MSNSNPRNFLNVKKPDVEVTEEATYNAIDTVSIVCKIQAVVKVTGQVTGNKYQWNGAGSKINVDKRDAEFLLKKKLGERACCGSGTNQMFELGE